MANRRKYAPKAGKINLISGSGFSKGFYKKSFKRLFAVHETIVTNQIIPNNTFQEKPFWDLRSDFTGLNKKNGLAATLRWTGLFTLILDGCWNVGKILPPNRIGSEDDAVAKFLNFQQQRERSGRVHDVWNCKVVPKPHQRPLLEKTWRGFTKFCDKLGLLKGLCVLARSWTREQSGLCNEWNDEKRSWTGAGIRLHSEWFGFNWVSIVLFLSQFIN